MRSKKKKNHRYTVKTDSDRKKTSKQVTVCLKIYVGFGEIREGIESHKKEIYSFKIIKCLKSG